MGRNMTWLEMAREGAGAATRVFAILAATATLAACTVGGPGLPSGEVTGAIPPRDGVPAATADAPAAARPKVARAKVAMLLPLSGPGQLAVVARAMKQAAELAVIDQGGPEFQLLVKDDLGTPDGARAAAEEAVREGAEIILGPLLSASVEAAAPVAAAARIPVVAFSNDRRIAGGSVYLLSFMPEQDVERIVAYAVGQGRRTFAALLPDDAFGQIVERAFTRAVASAQANVVAIERYGRSGSGMLEATRRLGEALANPSGSGAADALLVPGDPDTLASLGPLLAYARIDATRIKLLGTGGWDAPSLGRDPTFVGAWYPAPDQRGWKAFSERFTGTFGAAPPRIASVAHDAVVMAANLAAEPSATRFSATGLQRAGGFAGSDGAFRFAPDGTAARALAVHEVQSFGSSVVDPAGPALPTAQSGAAGLAPARPAQLNSLPGSQVN
jgi:ABC-type branched-subunit amino acid transport system substrate-binding protein